MSMVKKSQATIAAAWALSNSRQVGPQRRGAGSSPARFRIHHTVEGATRYPSPVVHRGCVDTLWVPNRSSTAVTCGIAGQ